MPFTNNLRWPVVFAFGGTPRTTDCHFWKRTRGDPPLSTEKGGHSMLVPVIVLSVAIAMMACEAACPGRSWPQVSGWWLRAALLNGGPASMVVVFGHAWRDWLIQHRLWSADSLGVVGGAVAGYLVL